MTVTAPAAMTAEANPRAARRVAVANEIKRQIGLGPLMSLGAHHYVATETDGGSPALVFSARILAMRADGTRGTQVRNMTVLIWLTDADDYGIRVAYVKRGKLVKHYEASGIYCDQLPRLILSLDFDGDTVRNPRLV